MHTAASCWILLIYLYYSAQCCVFTDSNSSISVTIRNQTNVNMNFSHSDRYYHLLLTHPVYTFERCGQTGQLVIKPTYRDTRIRYAHSLGRSEFNKPNFLLAVTVSALGGKAFESGVALNCTILGSHIY